jgi:hypothetical protein
MHGLKFLAVPLKLDFLPYLLSSFTIAKSALKASSITCIPLNYFFSFSDLSSIASRVKKAGIPA